MDSVQNSAFALSSGHSTVSVTLVVFILMIVIYTLWLAWISLASLRLWQKGQSELFDLTTVIIRGTFVVSIMALIFH